jgi:hypothetical protein
MLLTPARFDNGVKTDMGVKTDIGVTLHIF